MGFSDWSSTEWIILLFNIAAIGFVVWALRRRIRSKLDEVEERQQMSIHRRKEPKNDSSD